MKQFKIIFILIIIYLIIVFGFIFFKYIQHLNPNLEFFKSHDKRLVNVYNFSSISEPSENTCEPFQSNPVFLLIYVHSAPENHKNRLALRETTARRSTFRDIRLVFMLGKSSDEKVNALIRLESSIYQDILQDDFVDTYRNITYKAIMASKWLAKRCSKVKYLLKMDDDVMMDMFSIIRHLNAIEKHSFIKQSSRAFMCYLVRNAKVKRDKKSKWYMSRSEFPNDVLDPYCMGLAYFHTPDLPQLLYESSARVKFFWIDDYYVTSMLRKEVSAKLKQINSVFVLDEKQVESSFLSEGNHYFLFGHMSSLNNKLSRMYLIWEQIVKRQLKEYPQLAQYNSSLTENRNDFNYLHFGWSINIWKSFILPPFSLDSNEYSSIDFDSIRENFHLLDPSQ